ncbi:MAG: asparagine synthase-related protein [Limisphaerales bacterium]
MKPIAFLLHHQASRCLVEQRQPDGLAARFPLVSCARRGQQMAVVQGSLWAAAGESAGQDSPAARVLDAYQRGGIAALAALEGDYAVALVDLDTRRIIAGRDPLGGHPLFWAQGPDGWLVGSSVAWVARLAGCERCDPEYFYEFVGMPNAGLAEPDTGRTAVSGCTRVRPGEWLEFSLTNDVVRSAARWDWRGYIESGYRPESAAAAAACVGEGLRGAVERRLHGKVGCHFSGGMDSTGVALLAAAELKAKGGRLRALGKTYPGLRHLGMEAAFIAEAATVADNVDLHLLPQRAEVRQDAGAELPLFEEPYAGLCHAAGNEHFYQQARELGVETLLTGVGGVHLFDGSTNALIATHLRHGRWQRAYAHAQALAAQGDESAWTILRRATVGLLPQSWQSGVGAWLRGGSASWMELTDQTVPPWLRLRAGQRRRLFHEALGRMASADRTLADRVNSASLRLIRQQAGDVVRWYAAARQGIALTHPFFDVRLIRLAMNCPSDMRLAPGRQKPVLGSVLQGVLPESLIARRRKGHFGEWSAALQAGRLAADLAMIERTEVPDDVLDKSVLRQCAELAAAGVYRDVCALDKLRLTLAFLHWHERLPALLSEPLDAVVVGSLDAVQLPPSQRPLQLPS